MTDDLSEDLADMVRYSKIERCTITCKQLGSKTAEAIANALKANKVLKYFALNDGKVGDQGVVALAEALESNYTLVSLDLSGHQNITRQGMDAFANLLSKNKYITSLNINTRTFSPLQVSSVERKLKNNQEKVQKLAEVIFNKKEMIEKGFPFTSDGYLINFYHHVDQVLLENYLTELCKDMHQAEIKKFIQAIPQSLTIFTINDAVSNIDYIGEPAILGSSMEYLSLNS